MIPAVGLGATYVALRQFRKNANRSDHREALIWAAGYGLTWLAEWTLPFIATGKIDLSVEALSIIVASSALFAGLTYLGIRIAFWIRRARKK